MVDSIARKDVCGVCMGDDSTCRKVTGRFDRQPPTNSKLVHVFGYYGFIIIHVIPIFMDFNVTGEPQN